MKLTILQWNIWYREDIHNIVQFLHQNSADIICLQELTIGAKHQTVEDTPAYVAEQLGFQYFAKTLPIESPDNEPEIFANGIFSRYPIIKKRSVWINEPKSGGGYADEYRAYVEVTLDTPHRKLTVGTTHMSYTHQFESTTPKQAEADQLIRQIRKNPTGYIFAGDLNALPDSYTIDQLSRNLRHAGPDTAEKTWTTKPFSYNGFEASQLEYRLDYVFTTADITIESARTLPTALSDHLPLSVSLTWY